VIKTLHGSKKLMDASDRCKPAFVDAHLIEYYYQLVNLGHSKKLEPHAAAKKESSRGGKLN